MYDTKWIQFAGKHDFDKENTLFDCSWTKSASVGIFKWELKNNGKEMKKGKTVVRVSGPVFAKKEVFELAESIISELDNGTWDGRKNVKIK